MFVGSNIKGTFNFEPFFALRARNHAIYPVHSFLTDTYLPHHTGYSLRITRSIFADYRTDDVNTMEYINKNNWFRTKHRNSAGVSHIRQICWLRFA